MTTQSYLYKQADALKVPPQLSLLDAAEELAAAKASPDGAWLSPEAQALHEAEGAARFAKYHTSVSHPQAKDTPSASPSSLPAEQQESRK